VRARAFAVGCAVAVALVVGACGGDDGDSAADCGAAPDPARVTSALPSDLRDAAAPTDVLKDFEKEMDSEALERLAGRQVTKQGRVVAYVLVAEAKGPLSEKEFIKGLTAEAGDLGTNVQLGGGTGRLFEPAPGAGVIAGLVGRCSALIVLSDSPGQARNVAAALKT
jgi:hypothetical protein